MNSAARIVIWTLAVLVTAFGFASIAYPFFKLEMSQGAEQAFNLALGALIGVIGKTGLDAATEKLKREREEEPQP